MFVEVIEGDELFLIVISVFSLFADEILSRASAE